MNRQLTTVLLAGLIIGSAAMIAPQQAQAKHGWHNGNWNWHDNGRHLGWYRHRNWNKWDRYRYGPRNFNGAWFNRYDNRYYGNYPVYGRYRF